MMKALPILIATCAIGVAAVPPKPVPAKLAAAKKSGLDKKTMETYVRHLFVWPNDVNIEILDPKPSDIPGFLIVTARASKGAAHQDERFYVSKDGQRMFQMQGNYYQFSKNPFEDQISKLKVESRPAMGTIGAPVMIVEFSDFQCHYCKEEAKGIRENLLKDYPKDVRLYFMDFPLEGVHPWARAAAIAGRCVYRQDPEAFWAFHDWIFEHQEEVTSDNLRDKVLEWAKSTPLKSDALASCMDNKLTDSEVAKSISEGQGLQVGSTPTLFINGRPLNGAVPWGELKRIIDYEIGYQSVEKNAGDNCGCEVTIPKAGVK
jgi:protein-disulfide isomerase